MNGMMVAAVLIATVAFAAMVMPPGGVVPPPTSQPPGTTPSTSEGINITNINTTATTITFDHHAGHAALYSARHETLANAFQGFVFASFTLSMCSLMFCLAVMEIEEERRYKGMCFCCRHNCCLSDWRAVMALAYTTLVFAILFVYAAFVAAAAINFDAFESAVPNGRKAWEGCTIVSAIALGSTAFWLLLGPFSAIRWIARAWDKDVEEVIKRQETATNAQNWGQPNSTFDCCCLNCFNA